MAFAGAASIINSSTIRGFERRIVAIAAITELRPPTVDQCNYLAATTLLDKPKCLEVFSNYWARPSVSKIDRHRNDFSISLSSRQITVRGIEENRLG
jgi:hypothetical protein